MENQPEPAHTAGHPHHGHDHHHGPGHGGHAHGPSAPVPGAVKDPVCGMTVDPHTTPHRAEHGGKPYYFCSAGCRTKFVADPAKYLGERAAEAPPATPGT